MKKNFWVLPPIFHLSCIHNHGRRKETDAEEVIDLMASGWSSMVGEEHAGRIDISRISQEILYT